MIAINKKILPRHGNNCVAFRKRRSEFNELCHDSSKGARLYLGEMPGIGALDPVKSSLSNDPDVERSCQLSISKSRLIKAIRLRKSPRFIEASRGPLTSNRCQTQPEKRPTNAHVTHTNTHTHIPHVQTEPTRNVYSRREEEGRKGSTGSLSPGIQRIRDISRQNQLLIWFPGVGRR